MCEDCRNEFDDAGLTWFEMNQGCSKTCIHCIPCQKIVGCPGLKLGTAASMFMVLSFYLSEGRTPHRGVNSHASQPIYLGTVCKLINHLKWCTKSETQGKCHHQNAAVQGSCT